MDLLRTGRQQRAEGDLSAAAETLERAAASSPEPGPALYELGLTLLDLNRTEDALRALHRAAGLESDNPATVTAYGIALLRAGDPGKSAAALLHAANLAPDDVNPRLALAQALEADGKAKDGLSVLRQTAGQLPDNFAVWSALGALARRMTDHATARTAFEHALTLKPDDPATLINLGVIARAEKRYGDAEAYYRHALDTAPDSAVAHANLGNLLGLLNQESEAETHLREAIRLDPGFVDARYNLASSLTGRDRPTEALPLFQSVLETQPDRWDVWTNLGVAELAAGHVEAAERAYRRALDIRPDNAEAHYDLAWLLLLTGRFDEGWAELEWRWKLPEFSSLKRTFDAPRWMGEDLGTGTLLLHAEQGFGDAIQFVRFAAMAAEQCGQVILDCPPLLVDLFKDLEGIGEIIPTGAALPPCAAHAPLMSLPGIFGIDEQTIPKAGGYLSPPVDIPDHLRFAETNRRTIGLVWAGSPDNKIDRRRTLPAERLKPVFEATDARFVSLQVGTKTDEVAALPHDRLVFDCNGKVHSFTDTAAVISQLDLVIGVDTAVIHLAGALAKPAWVLLPYMPDYRWMLGRPDSPWYDTVRLFRQLQPGDWDRVIDQICRALTDW